MNTVIELLGWGDFNVQYTDAILTSHDVLDVDVIKQEYCDQVGIDSFNGLPYNTLNNHMIEFKKFLLDRGFSELKTKSVYFCD